MKIAGNDILIQSLIKEEVEYIFGYPGGAALHIYDAIFNQNQIQHILVRHEQGATHAADGYARATGKPGVVLVTSGPGATNAITGIDGLHTNDNNIWAGGKTFNWYRCFSRDRYDWYFSPNCKT